MAGWKLLHIGFEGDDVLIAGLNVWEHKWIDAGEGSITVPHPSYPSQSHRMYVYKLDTPSGQKRFAAGEFSNSVWGIYIPEDQ
jgi:hypothetical protein